MGALYASCFYCLIELRLIPVTYLPIGKKKKFHSKVIDDDRVAHVEISGICNLVLVHFMRGRDCEHVAVSVLSSLLVEVLDLCISEFSASEMYLRI